MAHLTRVMKSPHSCLMQQGFVGAIVGDREVGGRVGGSVGDRDGMDVVVATDGEGEGATVGSGVSGGVAVAPRPRFGAAVSLGISFSGWLLAMIESVQTTQQTSEALQISLPFQPGSKTPLQQADNAAEEPSLVDGR